MTNTTICSKKNEKNTEKELISSFAFYILKLNLHFYIE